MAEINLSNMMNDYRDLINTEKRCRNKRKYVIDNLEKEFMLYCQEHDIDVDDVFLEGDVLIFDGKMSYDCAYKIAQKFHLNIIKYNHTLQVTFMFKEGD